MGRSYNVMVLQRKMFTRKSQHWIYNNRMVYDCFNDPFPAVFGFLALNLPPITIDDRPHPHKRARYTPNLLPAAIYVATENYVSNLTTPSDLLDLIPSGHPNTLYVMKKYVPLTFRVKRGYWCRKHGQIRCYKKIRFYFSICSDRKKKFYYCCEFYRIISETRNFFLEHQHYMSQLLGWLLCFLSSILYFISWTCFVLVFFLFHWSLPVIYHMSALIDHLILFFFNSLNACNDKTVIQNIYTVHIHEYNRLLKKVMILCKKKLPIAC